MPDQADKLRKIIADTSPEADFEADGPPMVVVTGGKGGVGTTTVALNLAAALAHNGHRAVLVDLAPHADVAHLAGIEAAAGRTVVDVADGVCSAAEAMLAGPAGTQLIAGRWAPSEAAEWSAHGLDRLLRHLAELRNQVDVFVVDSGSGMSRSTQFLWRRAAIALLVTTVEDVGVMDAYATIKQATIGSQAAADSRSSEIRILVNRFEFATAAADAERRIAAACRRFLGRSIRPAPRLPRCDASRASAIIPRAWETPKSPFGRSVHQLGRFVADALSRQATTPVLAGHHSSSMQEFSTC
jgi:flagellar biosynthesis protein FlhG